MDIETFRHHLITPRDQVKTDPSRVGQAVHDILSKKQSSTTVGEIIDEYQHSYVKELQSTVDANANRYMAPFHVTVLHKKEPWAENIVRNWFIARQTRPHPKFLRNEFPNHANTTYEINQQIGKIEILWSLPTWQDCLTIMKNKHLYDPQLVKWIEDFNSGKLEKAG